MADTVAVFGEPEVEIRLGRDKWTADEAAVKPLDELLSLFVKNFGKEKDGYRRSVQSFVYKALPEPKRDEFKIGTGEGEYENADAAEAAFVTAGNRRTSRIAERLNERAAENKVAVHARVIRGTLHLVTGTKPVITRNRKPAEDETK